jgi:hypothetical protein
MMPARERASLEDLRGPGATLGAGVSAGFLAGALIGGVGGRLAMLVLRLTSNPALHGVSTDDGFTIGRVSAETLFLLGVTAGLGMAGGLFYLVARRWIASPWRIPLMTLFFGLVGGAGLIGPSDVDFRLLSPLSLAVALFVVIPAAYGAAMSWIAERLLREDSILRRGRRAWIVGLVPLAFANVVGLLILLVAFGAWTLGRSVPGLVEAWRSQVGTWLGRVALVAIAVVSGAGLLRDAIDILG